jgi:chromosome segregation ATPase
MQAVRSRTTAQAQQLHFEEDKERLTREQASAKHRHDALNRQLDEAIQDRDAFELDASKATRELALVQEERTVLQVGLDPMSVSLAVLVARSMPTVCATVPPRPCSSHD